VEWNGVKWSEMEWNGERGEKRLVVQVYNARPHTAKVTREFCDDNFLRIAPHPSHSHDLAPSDLFLFLVWASQKPPPMTPIRVCRWTSFGSSKNSGRNQRWHIGSGFLGVSVSTDWTDALQHCSIAGLQHCSKWKVRGMK
jgi:hypothetical protein